MTIFGVATCRQREVLFKSALFWVDLSGLWIGSEVPASLPSELGNHIAWLLAGTLTVVCTDHAMREGVYSSMGTHLSVPRILE